MQPLFQDQATKTVAPAGFIDITQKPANIVPAAQPQTTALTIVADNEIDKLGSRVGGNASKTAQLILASVKASDVDGFGTKLNELIAVSKQMDPKKMGKPGLLSKVTGFFGATKEKMLAQYETVEKRMNTLVGEMDKTVSLQQTRINDLEQMYIDNERAFYAYGEEIAQAQTYVEQLKLALAAEQANATTDMFASQRQHDIQARIERLEKKADDFLRSQQLCKLAAPEIRMMQSMARSLVSTFANIKETPIPAWQGVFSRYVLSMEQKRAAELGTAVQDATNEAFRMQADQLRENVTLIAKASQRSVVDIDTLEHMQNQLEGALNDAKRIADEGAKARADARVKLAGMDAALIQRNVSPTSLPLSN